MKKLIISFLTLTASVSTFAADPCISKGGQIENATLEKSLVRICTFEEGPGFYSAIGYNDIALASQGISVKSVKTYLRKKKVSPPVEGASVCKKQSAEVVMVSSGTNSISFCRFSDGSIIDALTLSNGSTVNKVLTEALVNTTIK